MNEAESLEALVQGWAPLGVEIDAEVNVKWKILHLSRLEVRKDLRKQGLGTKAMQDLVDLADQFGLMITLSPAKEFGATSVERLRRFYRRFGFVRNRGRYKRFEIMDAMYRRPVGPSSS